MYVSCKFIDKQHSVATALKSSFHNVLLHFANPHTLQLAHTLFLLDCTPQ